MDANELLPRPWFSADDTREPLRVRTIPGTALVFKEMNKEDKPVLKFINQSKFLILNRTHRDVMINTYGAETDGWGDKELELFSEADSRSITLRPLTEPTVPVEAQVETSEPEPTNEESPSGGSSMINEVFSKAFNTHPK